MTHPRVAVVGTGVVGAMTAWRLARRGAEVVALDTYSPGHDRGASAGESRIFRTIYKEGPDYVPLLRRSGELWRELESTTATSLLTMCGGLTIGSPDHPDVRAVRACAEEHGLDHEVLDTAEARSRFPQHRVDDDEVIVLDPAAGVLRPEPAVQAALRAAEEAGASVLPYHPVDGVAETSSGWRITSGGKHFDVDHVVFAPGPWALRLEPLRTLPVEIRLITACWFAVHDPAAHRPDRLPIAVRRHREAGFSCFPVLDGVAIKIVPHHLGWPVLDDPDGLPRSADPEFARAASAAAARLLPGTTPHPVRIATFAEGFTPDEHALLGPLPGHRNATVMTGFSGHGFKLAPVFGEIGADLALRGSTGHDITRLAPGRRLP
ncbi:sarcosine oxidase [Saccharopolyspora erythraea NRRL 2338]|uniref:Sarcosine oxidase n=2 Tax=Saccharopolyspora erythraea TaxID=1836 RepID=A4FDW6_SACEN|nr:N-methyl-L-tryptophan oxidase [Saccharopolyspora erythraea]EQD82524.1 sarcosine oxidase [Saccharopolyspora erythraea D]PFG95971.1 sarcosine oxidase [Saccharopolyspora erythraea NRRL 2338]QRK92535.1 N-methyl-L-tryptophan oxidase [Saccharopolyspora erythraea]CAM02241.1 sarcosine oxidase [Saccharopolyspora erythraea NRRL 2338]